MSTPGFRTFSPPLRRFLLATVVNMIGSAALFGFALIYLHEVRGIPLAQAGFAQGSMNLVVVVLTPVAGSLSDRFGARRVLTIGCVVSIVAGLSYILVDTFVEAWLVAMLLGLGNSLWFPSQAALLALIVEPSERPALSAFQRAALNLGAALGGVLGGFVVHADTLRSYQVLFVINAATYVVFLAVLPGLPAGRVAQVPDGPGFSAVLADGFFMRLLVTDLSIALGFGFLWAFTPAYASDLGMGKALIGVLFTFGALSVTLSQLPTLRWARGRSRMRSLAWMNLWFAAAFVVMLFTPHTSIAVAAVLIAVSQSFGGFGEAFLGAVRSPLTSDLAPPELVGRYHGLATMVFQGGMGLATTLGGVFLEISRSAIWGAALVVSLLGVAGSLALERRIPRHLVLSA